MTKYEFNRKWDAAADDVAAALIHGITPPDHPVRRGWRWKTIRQVVIGKVRMTLRWRRRVI